MFNQIRLKELIYDRSRITEINNQNEAETKLGTDKKKRELDKNKINCIRLLIQCFDLLNLMAMFLLIITKNKSEKNLQNQ